MKITVVTGMLGAGKTTFIRRYLSGSGEKTVVLVNDFGKAGIDGEIFSADGFESVELPSGCVCCTLKVDLITTVQKIADTLSPEHLVIEPSGVASPSGVLEALEGVLRGPVTVVGVVDATEFTELYESDMHGAFFEDQITSADVILVNKADIAAQQMIASTERVIRGLNPHAVLFRTVRAEVEGPLPGTSGIKRRGAGPEAHFHFDTLSMKVRDGVALLSVERFFDEMARGTYGSVVRAKALVRAAEGMFRLDLSYGKTETSSFGGEVASGRLVVIGEGLDGEGMQGFFGVG